MADEKILAVKRLKISFRTNNGTVKAVRDISFDLYKGKTLAIVGESGSGKSVTSKAILGILAGNSIIEGGEILYDGKDLLKLDEEGMYNIRGDKIAMIFQDPLSSLNPIVKIGQQITEAMILKNKASRRTNRKEFNERLAILKNNMIEVVGKNNSAEVAKINEMIKSFNGFNIKSIELETDYNASVSDADDLIADLNDFVFLAGKNQKIEVAGKFKGFAKALKNIKNDFLIHNYVTKISELANKLSAATQPKREKATEEDMALANEALALLNEMLAAEKPNFFRIGYYAVKNPGADLHCKPIAELNEDCLKYLNENFMSSFIPYSTNAVKNSYNKSLAGKKETLKILADFKQYFSGEFTKEESLSKIENAKAAVEASIDDLALVKDTLAITFITSITSHVNKYFQSIIDNVKDEKRFNRQKAKHDALIARGKTVDWKVVPKKEIDIEDIRLDILSLIERLEKKYTDDVAASETIDYEKLVVALVDQFKEKASLVVYKVTRKMAKEKAIKLMEEVGIPEPRIRFYQYPFEFSGGMRQRIVIAIALVANPDILICDEPTTALDVTIQSQILELINRLKVQRNLSVIFITHDLGVVANMADDIAVMYAGKIVEYGTSEEIFYSPAHPYTWALLSSMPDLDTKEKLESIPGTPPNMIFPPVGDAFAARNKYALKIDFEQQPPMFKISDTHYAATWLLHENAPKVEMPKIIKDRIERMKAQNEKGGNN